MHSSLLSRGVLNLGLALVLVGGLCLVGWTCAEGTARSLGLDVWNLPRVLRDEAHSSRAMRAAEAAKVEMAYVSEVREEVLKDVLLGRLTLAEGLDRFRDLAATTPTFRRTLDGYFSHLPPEEALRTYYRRVLEDALDEYPIAVAQLRPELDDLFPAARVVKPMS